MKRADTIMKYDTKELAEYLMEPDDPKAFRKNSKHRLIILCVYVLAFMVLTLAQSLIALRSGQDPVFFTFGGLMMTRTLFNGVMAQVKIIVALGMTIQIYRNGAVVAVILNIISMMGLTRFADAYSDPGTYLGYVVPIITIAIVLIIYLYQRMLVEKLDKLRKHKNKILTLNEELAAAEEEASQQNRELIEYNQMLLDSEKRLNFLAYYDVLTNLPNRAMTISRLRSLTETSDAKSVEFSVAVLDIDDFKRINDSAGHNVGDLIIEAVSERLKNFVPKSDFIGRFSGDEFVVVMTEAYAEKDALIYADQLKNIMREPFSINNSLFSLTMSVGVAGYPRDGETAEEILRCADTAMSKAKENGKDFVMQYCNDMKFELMNRIIMEKNLATSLDNNEIFLVFQPQYNACSDTLRGFETLVRWNSKKLGFISPAQFIPVAESTKYINKLGSWILKTACEKFKVLCDKSGLDMILSVNISAVQIMNPGFSDEVAKILETTGFNPRQLELELTESVLISSLDYVTELLSKFKAMGIKVALDDFGTGFSSLSYLQKLPIDTLKIDKSFVDNIDRENSEKALAGSIISLVHKLGMEVVAEGVENHVQLSYLKAQDCDYIQGFLLGKPLEEKDMTELVNSRQTVNV